MADRKIKQLPRQGSKRKKYKNTKRHLREDESERNPKMKATNWSCQHQASTEV